MTGRKKGYRQHPKYGRMFLTVAQFNLLDAINACRLQGDYFVDLTDAHNSTVKSLVERGYIAPRSADPGEHIYRMTGLGLEAYLLFKPGHLYRKDGICPRCGQRPRQDYGYRLGNYCVECAAVVRHNHYRAKAARRDPNKPCARCGATPRHVTPAAVSSYCIDCYHDKAREARPRREQRIRDNAAQGKPTICAFAGCDQPVRITDKSISAYCLKHSAAMKARADKRRIARKFASLRIVPAVEYQQAGD